MKVRTIVVVVVVFDPVRPPALALRHWLLSKFGSSTLLQYEELSVFSVPKDFCTKVQLSSALRQAYHAVFARRTSWDNYN